MFQGYTRRPRLFHLAPLALVFLLVFAACGGDDDDDVGSIEDAETCEDVGDVFAAEMQTLLDELSDMEMSEFTSDEEPEAMTNFQSSIGEIGAKSGEIGCSDEEAAEIMSDRLDDLEADGPVAEIILESFREGIESGEIFNGGASSPSGGPVEMVQLSSLGLDLPFELSYDPPVPSDATVSNAIERQAGDNTYAGYDLTLNTSATYEDMQAAYDEYMSTLEFSQAVPDSQAWTGRGAEGEPGLTIAVIGGGRLNIAEILDN